MAPPPVDPVDSTFTQIVIGSTGAILVAIGTGIVTIIRSLYRRIDALEKDSSKQSHDLKGMRQEYQALERFTEIRHEENKEERENDRRENREAIADLRNFIAQEFRSVGQRVDRLLSRTKDDH